MKGNESKNITIPIKDLFVSTGKHLVIVYSWLCVNFDLDFKSMFSCYLSSLA